MSAETFNACVYLVDRQVEAGGGDHLAVTGPAGSLTYAELAARAAELAAGFGACGVRVSVRAWADVLAAGQQADPAAPYGTWHDSPAFWPYASDTTGRPKAATGKIQRVVVREVVAQRLGKPGE